MEDGRDQPRQAPSRADFQKSATPEGIQLFDQCHPLHRSSELLRQQILCLSRIVRIPGSGGIGENWRVAYRKGDTLKSST
jgi:hypothetical protein